MTGRLRMLYISGYGRSGSTLLDGCLGGLAGVSSLGQFVDLPELYRHRAEARCSCGETLDGCPRWRGLFEEQRSRLEALAAHPAGDPFFGVRRRPRELAQALRFRLTGRLARTPAAYRKRQVALLAAIARRDRARWLCDSSKKVLRALALLGLEACDVRLIQLVRDPRGVMLSKRDPKSARRAGPLLTVSSWAYHNLLTRLVYDGLPRSRRIRVFYEKLAGSPRRELERIAARFGLPDGPTGSGEVWVDPAERHIPSGNVMRFGGRRKLEYRTRSCQLSPLERVVWRLVGLPVFRFLGGSAR